MASNRPEKIQPVDFIEGLYKKNVKSEELLQIFVKNMNMFHSSIYDKKLSDDSLSLLVHLIARVCDCTKQKRNREICQLLNMLSASPLFKNRSNTLLLGKTCNYSCDHSFQCLLSDFLTILQEIYLRIPRLSTTPQVMRLGEHLKEQISECDDLEDKGMMMDIVMETMKGIRHITGERSRAKQDAEDKFLPPDDFRTVSVIPEQNDILNIPKFLRRNKVCGKYMNLDHYLDVQFRLYREDCVSPLRDALLEFKQKDKADRKENIRLEHGLLYKNVKVMKQIISIDSGEVFEIKLDPEHRKRVNWGNGKRLIYGTLLLISFDRFNTVFVAIVAESETKILQKKGSFTVQVFRYGNKQNLPRNTDGIIIESNSSYFEAYRHVLKALQQIREETSPFTKYLVHCENKVRFLSYISKHHVYDLRPVIKNCRIDLDNTNRRTLRNTFLKQTPINIATLSEEDWPSTEMLKMDESQRKAFIAALTKEFVLIQGPPGTGKTYLALQIAKTLLHNTNRLNMNSKGKDEKYTRNARIIATKPYMLVVCYTNHALDQFVQGIIDFMPETPSGHRCFPEIVRFGSRSKNPKFEELSIKNLRSRVRLKPHFPRDEVLKEASKAKRKIKEIRKTIEALKSKNIVLWFDEIKCVLTKNFASQFGEKFVWLQWLNVSEQSWYEEVNKQYQNQRNDEAIKNLLGGFAAELEEVEFVSLISEKETAYSVRYLEVDDVDFSLNTDTIGLDLDMQYENELHKTNKLEKKCKLILRLEKEKAARELHYGKAMSEGQVKQIKSIWKLSIKDRWKMYRYWLMQYVKILHEQLRKSEKEFHDIFDDYRHNSIEKDEIIMKQATVLAMTTTSAARYRESLSKVDPLITIIEEAAEVPEAHIVTAISPRCKHLILIGDHKQLQPKPAVHELAIKFNLSVSLFERMVMNNLSYYCLQRQHRMRPEISELVRHIYHTLYDNENVYEYPPIKGVHKSLYFITHNKQEAFKDEGRSFSNEYEAEYLKELYLYLLKQRYEPSEITILTAYAGQTSCLEGKLPSSKFKGVKICVLDNYQGEENEIILLSLVRSNTTGDIGFLNRENRICVALSRAKQGLFIIGNSDTLTKKSQHWQTVIGKLQMQENVNDINKTSPIYQGIGKGLPLYCQNHPKKKGILAESPSDFKKVKDGGCDIPCEFRLPCGHECRYDCHPFDKEHKTYKCKKQCTLTCVEGHKCFKRCHYADECRCSVEMKRELKCHHTIFLQCHVHYSKYPCPFKVSRTLLCGHTSSIECHVDPNTVLCTVSVDRELECGHTAQLNCHIDPNRHECAMILTETRSKCGHKFERRCHDANYEILNKCKVLINEKRTSCDHLIERNCFDTTYEMRIDCSITVTMNRSSCGHEYQRQCHDRMYAMSHKCIDIVTEQWSSCKHYYKRHCFESDFVMRHTCQSKTVDKRIDCGHEFVRTCSDTNYQHKHKCCVYVEKNVPKCGHKVKLPCHQDVSTVKCKESVTKVLDCKHVNRYECFKIDTIKCKVKCNKICINGHVCTKTCHFPTPCDCQELIKTILEGCKHQQTIPCSIDSKVYPCKTMVKKVLNKCQHLQYMQCHIDPETIRCTFAVLKSLPKCGHEEMVFCSENLSGAICTKEVEIKLDKCGHSVGIKCWQKKYMPLQEVKCFEPTLHTRSDCGHITTIPCWEISSHDFTPCQKLLDTTLSCGHVIKSVCSVEEETICDKRCDKPLSCGHPCPGVCHECDHNQDCSRQCERELVCGHACPSEVSNPAKDGV
ncbi:NFX1-type zinc finger-containing protein 1-like [Mytilus trossulus]|uniref:NFX1-type zinc finger-containing protein 1-like n=1 Tax=Mytilus trossulus TaxID=6551 RepID=UPI0030063305